MKLKDYLRGERGAGAERAPRMTHAAFAELVGVAKCTIDRIVQQTQGVGRELARRIVEETGGLVTHGDLAYEIRGRSEEDAA